MMSTQEDNSTFDGLYRTLAFELDDLNQTLEEVEESNFVLTAQGNSLDRIGELFDVARRTGESDEQFRLQIITRFAQSRGAGTIPDISQAFAQLLDVDEDDFELFEPDDEILVVEFAVDEFLIQDSGFDEERFFETLDTLLAAGVTLEGILIGTFEFSVSEIIEDEVRGFSELDAEGNVNEEIGGRWSYLR